MLRFSSLEKARAELDEYGGVLLDQGDHYLVGWVDVGPSMTMHGRTLGHVDSLAPSYDETHPDNENNPAQADFFTLENDNG